MRRDDVKKRHRSYWAKYYEFRESSERVEYLAEWHAKNRTRRNADAMTRYHLVMRTDPRVYMLYRTKARAKRCGLDFDLTPDDIAIPEFCPALGIKLVVRDVGKKGPQAGSPSLDRIDPTRGYVRGNVCVVSTRANTLKNDATTDELEAVLAYMRAHGAP
jgi:hypothetical protein